MNEGRFAVIVPVMFYRDYYKSPHRVAIYDHELKCPIWCSHLRWKWSAYLMVAFLNKTSTLRNDSRV